MNGKQATRIRKWAFQTWNSTPEDQRIGLNSFKHYLHRVKAEWKRNLEFRKFMSHTTNNGLI